MDNPYQSPSSTADVKRRDWEPNTWLLNWSLTFGVLFSLLDLPFVFAAGFKESVLRYLFANLIAQTVILGPAALMLYVDGVRGIRAAPFRALMIVGNFVFHLCIMLQRLIY